MRVIELQVVPECPYACPALGALREACRLAGLNDLPVTVTLIDSAEKAQRRGFTGSPTFLIDGVDPFAVDGAPAGLACRIYATADGPAGVPDVSSLREALVRA